MRIVKFGTLATVKTDMKEADFWIERRNTIQAVGRVHREYKPERIGVKITATDDLHPGYMSYWFEHVHTSGLWETLATGTTNLVNIKVEAIKNLPIALEG